MLQLKWQVTATVYSRCQSQVDSQVTLDLAAIRTSAPAHPRKVPLFSM